MAQLSPGPKRTLADIARRAGIKIELSASSKVRERADILVLTGDNADDSRQKYREELARLTGALNGSSEIEDIISVFMPPVPSSCTYIGTVDRSHVIRSGVLIAKKHYDWDIWRHCFGRGMLRLSGMLGGVIKSSSVMEWNVYQVGFNGHEKHVLSALYSPEIKNGMARADALRITEKAHRL